MNNVQLYSKVIKLKNYLEIRTEFTAKQLIEAMRLINQVNEVLDRRKK